MKDVLFPSSSGPRGGAYSIRPYNRVRVRVQTMDLYSPLSVASGGAYSIRPYNWIRVTLRNTDVIPQLGTCEGSKNGSVYATVGGVWWGVFNTPLRPGTCDLSKYRCNFPTEYVRPFKKLSCFHPLRGRGVGRIQYAPTTGYVQFFEIPM